MAAPRALAVLAAIGVSAVFPASLAAEPDAPLVEAVSSPAEGYFGARVGYLSIEGVDPGSFNFGLVGAYLPSSVLGLEASLDYHEADFAGYDRGTFALQASLVLYPVPRARRIRPYVLGGVGYYYSDYEVASGVTFGGGDDSAHDAGFHAGFGFDFAAPEAWSPEAGLAFTMDVRYLFTRDTEPSRPELDGYLITIGFKLFLD